MNSLIPTFFRSRAKKIPLRRFSPDIQKPPPELDDIHKTETVGLETCEHRRGTYGLSVAVEVYHSYFEGPARHFFGQLADVCACVPLCCGIFVVQ